MSSFHEVDFHTLLLINRQEWILTADLSGYRDTARSVLNLALMLTHGSLAGAEMKIQRVLYETGDMIIYPSGYISIIISTSERLALTLPVMTEHGEYRDLYMRQMIDMYHPEYKKFQLVRPWVHTNKNSHQVIWSQLMMITVSLDFFICVITMIGRVRSQFVMTEVSWLTTFVYV